MTAVRDALILALEMLDGVVGPKWGALLTTVRFALGRASWDDGDDRWQELVKVVTDFLRELRDARAIDGVDLGQAARAAAELRYTRKLRDLGLIGEV